MLIAAMNRLRAKLRRDAKEILHSLENDTPGTACFSCSRTDEMAALPEKIRSRAVPPKTLADPMWPLADMFPFFAFESRCLGKFFPGLWTRLPSENQRPLKFGRRRSSARPVYIFLLNLPIKNR